MRNYLNRDFNKIRSDDILSKEKRSVLMSKIHSKETGLEKDFILNLKKATRKKFLTNVATLRGKPDIVFQRGRLCIFIDSDFWHGWQYPRWKHLLKNDFWREKIEKNRKRDLLTTQYLKRQGWKVLRIWEHKIRKDLVNTIEEISTILIKNENNRKN